MNTFSAKCTLPPITDKRQQKKKKKKKQQQQKKEAFFFLLLFRPHPNFSRENQEESSLTHAQSFRTLSKSKDGQWRLSEINDWYPVGPWN